jgi:hypothetical protein
MDVMQTWFRRASTLANDARVALSFALVFTSAVAGLASAPIARDPIGGWHMPSLTASLGLLAGGLIVGRGQRLLDYLATFLTSTIAALVFGAVIVAMALSE